MDRFVISIGRQLGSGGREIGKKLAAEFGIRFLDSELITLAAKESGFGAEFFRDTDEKKGFFNTLFNRIQSGHRVIWLRCCVGITKRLTSAVSSTISVHLTKINQ